MMKYRIFILFMFLETALFATVQEKDTLYVNGEKLLLDQTYSMTIVKDYCLSLGIHYPFTSTITSNYRGYVASWQFKDSMLHIVSISNYHLKKNLPDSIKSMFLSTVDSSSVFLYSGILMAESNDKNNKHYYLFDVLNGKMISMSTYKDRRDIWNGVDHLSSMYNNYIRFSKEIINNEDSRIGKDVLCNAVNKNPLFLIKDKQTIDSLFHELKIYHFVSKWEIRRNKLCFSDVELLGEDGRQFSAADIGIIDKKECSGKLNGIFLAFEPSRSKFSEPIVKGDEYTIFYVENGVIKEKHKVGDGDLSDRLLELLKKNRICTFDSVQEFLEDLYDDSP